MTPALRLALLLTLVDAAPASAQSQEPTREHVPGRTPAIVGVAATLVPVPVGAATIAATDADGAGFLTMYGGAVLGPAIGNWSAGLTSRGFTGLAIRSGIAAVTLAAPFVACPGLEECGDAASAAAVGLFVLGNIGLLAHDAWDLGTLPKRARERATRVSIAPAWSTLAHGPALELRFRF